MANKKTQETLDILRNQGSKAGEEKRGSVARKRSGLKAAPVQQMAEFKPAIMEIMPVSKTKVEFRFDYIEPSLIDIHPSIPRIQTLLTKASVMDILPSIGREGQAEAGILRPKGDGRYELLDGSRRLYCIKQIGGSYYAKIGDIPDDDVLSIISIRDQKLPHSDYEKGQIYLSLIPGRYRNETVAKRELAQIEGVSESTIYRRIHAASAPEWFVTLFDTPNDMSVSDVQWLKGQLKTFSEPLEKKGAELKKKKMEALEKGELIPMKEILGQLKSITLKKVKKPGKKKVLVHKDKKGEAVLKETKNSKDHQVFEILSAGEAESEKIREFIFKTLKIST